MRNLLKMVVVAVVFLAIGLVWPPPSVASSSHTANQQGGHDELECGRAGAKGTLDPGGLAGRSHIGGEARGWLATQATIDPAGSAGQLRSGGEARGLVEAEG